MSLSMSTFTKLLSERPVGRWAVGEPRAKGYHRRASARAKRLEYDPSYSSARCRFETAPRQCAPQWRCGAHCPSAGRSGWTAASAPGSDRVSETNRQNFSDLEHLGLELLVSGEALRSQGTCKVSPCVAFVLVRTPRGRIMPAAYYTLKGTLCFGHLPDSPTQHAIVYLKEHEQLYRKH